MSKPDSTPTAPAAADPGTRDPEDSRPPGDRRAPEALARAEAESGPVPWHHLEVEAVVARLESDAKAGLSETEAGRRLREHGRNEIRRVETTAWYRVFARQFTNALILILLVAAGISAGLGDLTDALAIGAIVLLNGVLGFLQEWKTERAVAALQRMLQPRPWPSPASSSSRR